MQPLTYLASLTASKRDLKALCQVLSLSLFLIGKIELKKN